MIIETNTSILLFRFSDYSKYSFIDEHLSIIKQNGYTWMLKAGRKTNTSKLQDIISQGGWIVLKAPKARGGKLYLGKFEEIRDKAPEDSERHIFIALMPEMTLLTLARSFGIMTSTRSSRIAEDLGLRNLQFQAPSQALSQRLQSSRREALTLTDLLKSTADTMIGKQDLKARAERKESRLSK